MGRLTINELFEPILPNIMELYVEKLSIREANDEFGLDNMEDPMDYKVPASRTVSLPKIIR